MNWESAGNKLRIEDHLSFLAILVSAGSVFLPWFQIELNASFSVYRSSEDLGRVNGTFFICGGLCLIFLTISAIMLFLRIRGAFIAGVLNLAIGFCNLMGLLDNTGQLREITGEIGNVSYRLSPQYGLFLFLFCSLFLIISLIQSERAYREFLRKESLS